MRSLIRVPFPLLLAWLLAAPVFAPRSAQARPLQIIHTNDLHSHFESLGYTGAGGYAAVKATIDRLKEQSRAQGIDTLVLDAGDFSEGSEFFLAGEGRESWKLIDSMGYDAIAIGNHDWLVGLDQMNQLVGEVNPLTPFVSANLGFGAAFSDLARHVHSYVPFNRAGSRIAVIGLSTDELVYKWRVKKGGFISSVTDTAARLVPPLAKAYDFVFALTHIGVDADRALVESLSGIDLVVGGHSHTVMQDPAFATNPAGHQVPIVQTGYGGEFVGAFLVDLEPGKPLKVLHYELVPVKQTGLKDLAMEARVVHARSLLDAKYGKDWLSEVLAESAVPMQGPDGYSTVWGDIYGQAMQEAAGADAAVDIGKFYAENIPAGPITREKLFQFYPRTFDLTRPYGWSVWKVRVSGWLLKMIVIEMAKLGKVLNFSGITYQLDQSGGKMRVSRLRIGGRRIRDWKTYHLAVSEGLGRGGTDLSILLRAVFEPEDQTIPVWQAVENKVRSLGPVIGGDPSRAPASANVLTGLQ